ncbi:MAG TPA: twin-arginine translocase subunit TatB, partial [Erwinia persicina]|nr:twin-arginine translocase subunit TatB [Erwinia persicina]
QAPVTVTQSASTPPPEPQEPPASTAPRASVPPGQPSDER